MSNRAKRTQELMDVLLEVLEAYPGYHTVDELARLRSRHLGSIDGDPYRLRKIRYAMAILIEEGKAQCKTRPLGCGYGRPSKLYSAVVKD